MSVISRTLERFCYDQWEFLIIINIFIIHIILNASSIINDCTIIIIIILIIILFIAISVVNIPCNKHKINIIGPTISSS